MPDAYGAYGAMPGGPQMPMDASGPMGPIGSPGNCPICGGAGCDACGGGAAGYPGGVHNGLLGDVMGLVFPYADGGCGALRWYDISVEAMRLTREDPGRRVDFTSEGIGGPIVLHSGMIDFDDEYSFRVSGLWQVGPGSSAEFTYFGLFFWDEQVEVRDQANNLFSVVSQFGLLPFGGFVETDRSDLQSIDYESSFDSFELNYRYRWMAPNCRYQGSWLVGARYFKLDEDFEYTTQSSINGVPGSPAGAEFSTNVHNDLLGFQLGGDVWVCIVPGFRLGGEFKAGVYNDNITVNNEIEVTDGVDDATFLEEVQGQDVSLVAQADIKATYRLNYNWTLTAGYHFLFVEGVALGPENFNPVPPAIFFPPPGVSREEFINDSGNVFYHGYTAGIEYLW